MEWNAIDVSSWQGEIDWEKVKAGGIDYAMLRSSLSSDITDTRFEENYSNAKSNSINVGAYHYTYATTTQQAIQEATHCLSVIKDKTFELPIALDIEAKLEDDLTKYEITEIIKAFCSTIEDAGYYVSVYANLYWLNNRIDQSIPKIYDIWLAQWASEPTFNQPFGMWQYTSTGTVPGIRGNVDRDIIYKDYPAIMKENGLNGYNEDDSSNFDAGTPVELDNTPIYISAYEATPAANKTGTFYLYDGININDRYRITVSPDRVLKTPIENNVTGYVNKEDI